MSRNDRSQVVRLAEQLDAVSAAFTALYNEIGDVLAMQRPRPSSWSAAECISHLAVTSEAYFPVWEASIERARRSGLKGGGRLRLGLLTRLLLWSFEPPPMLRISSPPQFAPQEGEPAREALELFIATQRRLRDLLKEAEGLPVDRIKIASPFDSRLRFTVWASLHMVAAHQRRHLWQAQRAAESVKHVQGSLAWSAK